MADLWGRTVVGKTVLDPTLPIERNPTNLIAINNAKGPYVVTLGPILRASTSLLTGFPGGVLTACRVEMGGGGSGGGAKKTVLLDWPSTGGTFSVNADTLDVDALSNTDAQTAIIWTAYAVRASGAGGLIRPRRTIRYADIAPGTNATQDVPLCARRARFQMVSTIDGNPFIVWEWLDAAGVGLCSDISTFGTQKSLVDITQPWEVPSGAVQCRITNGAASPIVLTGVRMAYELDIG